MAVNEAIFAYAEQRRNELKPNKRIAYYTTADTALKIIQNKSFWLRNPQLMNDYEEVLHGRYALRRLLDGMKVVVSSSARQNFRTSG